MSQGPIHNMRKSLLYHISEGMFLVFKILIPKQVKPQSPIFPGGRFLDYDRESKAGENPKSHNFEGGLVVMVVVLPLFSMFMLSTVTA